MKILVVDDSRGLAHIVKMMLADEDNEIRFARDVRDGYLTFLLFKPDVVITDIPPGENSSELMESIRKYDPKIRAIYTCSDPAYLGPALAEEKTRFQVRLLPKPFSRSELVMLFSQFE